MPRSRNEQELTGEFAKDYRLAQSQVMLEIERAVCGCDFGGTSYTTRSEAEDIARLLELKPSKRLLEVGSGSGWPGLYFAQITGCEAVLIDVPLEALRIAAERADTDQISNRCWSALADGAALPFGDSSFHAISHSDVLCCLEEKRSVLSNCRRVLRRGGKMVFTVISTAPGLSSANRERAIAQGPPYVDAPADYPELLDQNGWTIESHTDLTRGYSATTERSIRIDKARASELRDLLGQPRFDERMTKQHTTLGAIEEGLLRRDLFVVTTTT